MEYIVIMGMQFEAGTEPDFGSIYRSKEGQIKDGQDGVHEYGLNSEDVDKLDLITNARPGSTALCDDTADIYRLTKSGEWQKFGEDAVSTRSVQSAPTVAPLSLGKSISEPNIETKNDFIFDEYVDIEKEENIEDEKEVVDIEEPNKKEMPEEVR